MFNFVVALINCSAAARVRLLTTSVKAAATSWARLPFGCYYHSKETQLLELFNPNGVRDSEDTGRTSICTPRFAVRGVGNCEAMGGAFVPVDSLARCSSAGHALNLVDTRASDISPGRSEP